MISIGTCSWTEKTLLKSAEFYPAGMSAAEDRLRYYADHFPVVEVDSTYYAIPAQKTAWLWAQRTPDDFIFHIKAYGALTGHGVDPGAAPRDLRDAMPKPVQGRKLVAVTEPSLRQAISARFVDALSPLRRSGKLGMVVFQFPPWFRYGTANLDEILRCRETMAGLRIAVEFRHGSWLTPRAAPTVLGFLREHGITYVIADEPQYGTLATVPFLTAVTTDTAYVRFHGRNRANWLRKGIDTSLRYDYRYSDRELSGFADALRECANEAGALYAMFNNCHGASAVKNALRLRELWGDKKKA